MSGVFSSPLSPAMKETIRHCVRSVNYKSAVKSFSLDTAMVMAPVSTPPNAFKKGPRQRSLCHISFCLSSPDVQPSWHVAF
eukprot:6206792-Pleurochrysis_carterae.AAC.1